MIESISNNETHKREKRKISVASVRVANSILAAQAIAALFTLLYFTYYYGYTGQRQFTSSIGVLLYYVVPAALTTLLLASLKWSPAYRLKLAIFCLACTASLYAAELSTRALRLVARNWSMQITDNTDIKNIARIAKRLGVEFDTRKTLDVIEEFRNKGIDAVPSIPPGAFLKMSEKGILESKIHNNGTELIPLGGIANKTTVFCNENGDYTVYQSDQHGFHNPKSVWALGPVDVAVIGDSFAHGACVPTDKNFVALIRQHYPATVNLGVQGMGPLLELAVVKEYLPYIKPKTILWGYFEKNDLIDLGNEKTNRLLMKYLEDGFTQDLFHRQAEIDRALVDLVESGMAKQRKQEALQRKRENELFSHLDKFLEILKLGALRARLELIYGIEGNQKSREMPMTNLTLLRRILKQAKTAVSRWGGQIYFVYLPAWERYAESKIAPKDRDAVIELVRELGLPLIDLHPVFRTHRDPLSLFPFRGFGHYNEAGNLVVANTILRFISASGELSRSM